MDYISIIEQGYIVGYDSTGHKIYQLNNGQNKYLIKLLFNNINSNKTYSKYLQFKKDNSIFWQISEIEDFFKKYLIPKLKIQIISKRLYGEPKLKKPKELKNIKQSFSLDFIPKKCKFPCFVKNNDLYIYCRDYYSQCFKPNKEDYDKSLSYKLKKYFNYEESYQKFIYDDNWGSIVLRNECWFKIQNILLYLKINSPIKIKDLLIKEWCKLHNFNYTEIDYNWNNIFEQIPYKLNNYIINEEKL